MAGEAIEADHFDPEIEGVERAGVAASLEILLQRRKLAQRFGMIEGEQVSGFIGRGVERNFGEPVSDGAQLRRLQAAAREHLAQRIDVATKRHAPEQRGLNQRGAASHERVIDDFAGRGESLDEKPGQLRFETGAVGNLVQGTGLPLARGPELVDEGGHHQFGLVRRSATGFQSASRRAEPGKRGQLGRQIAAHKFKTSRLKGLAGGVREGEFEVAGQRGHPGANLGGARSYSQPRRLAVGGGRQNI